MNQNRYRFLTLLNIVLFIALVLGTVVLIDLGNNKNDLPVSDTFDSFGCGRLDINNNNKIELDDFAAFAKAYNDECSVAPLPTSYPSCGFKDADKSGKVDLPDFAWFANLYYNETCTLLNTGGVTNENSITESDITLYYKYNQENEVYEYTLSGEKPTPCHTVSVTDSYDSAQNKVTVSVDIKAGSSDVICNQVFVPFEETGAVSGNELTTFELVVVNKTQSQTLKTLSKEDGSAKALFEYQDHSVWHYSVNGYVPNGCASAQENTIKDGDKIDYTISITTQSSSEVFCTQALEPYFFEGYINATADADISFREIVADSPAP
ncbi:hypothetical protein KC678_03585 [Candidatus Dojkabacteria bacterium]|uniref:EF-hand domain-containing protein n=1 Tax=Candidatus Dojkabacteria bacterium TaxID=2099670 RepID=A0A955L1T9_9BACT|nr:hypothetical protein [Candidatus Dojkabacteria bacterium]